MVKNDIAEARKKGALRFPWSKEHRISWVEWRIRELTIRDGKSIDQRSEWLLVERAAGGRKLEPGDKVADYAVWLFWVRDGLSWHQIAYRFFPSATERDIGKYVLRVRRMYNRVERNHPGSATYKPPKHSEQEKLLLEALRAGVVPIFVAAPVNLTKS